jgi:chemosensory pili system protein ChpC
MSRQLLDISETVDLITMLLPVNGKSLLLPNVSVAEIIQVLEMDELEDVPTWFKGMVGWRGYAIPLLSFEAINDEPFAADSNKHAAVLNGAVDGAVLPFYAIATQSTPRMMRISSREVVENSEASAGPAELAAVNVCGETASIPNLDLIETEVIAVLKQLGFGIANAG